MRHGIRLDPDAPAPADLFDHLTPPGENTMSVTLGAPVVVAEFTAYCDRADHEVTVLTDGRRVTAGTTGLTGVQFTSAVSREDTLFRVTCDRLDRHDEPCGGEVIVDQSDKDCWRAATAADAAWLDSSAQTVDQ